MYLQTFEEKLLPPSGENRRRYPRVKPDEFGRFDAAELTPDVVLVDEPPKSTPKRPFELGAIQTSIFYQKSTRHNIHHQW